MEKKSDKRLHPPPPPNETRPYAYAHGYVIEVFENYYYRDILWMWIKFSTMVLSNNLQKKGLALKDIHADMVAT